MGRHHPESPDSESETNDAATDPGVGLGLLGLKLLDWGEGLVSESDSNEAGGIQDSCIRVGVTGTSRLIRTENPLILNQASRLKHERWECDFYRASCCP